MKTLQDFADGIVSPAYRQALKTVDEACAANGWTFQDVPQCCGTGVTRRSIFGSAYFAQCETCGLFIVDVTGPMFSDTGSSVSFIDTDKFPKDTEWKRSWIAGKEER